MAIEKILLGGGCFWCIEAAYRKVEGVVSAVSGYAGGENPNPTYQQICTGTTGHAEVVEVTFDSEIISCEEILEIFFVIHNPTTLNAQGADVGTQYRSVIFYYSDAQKECAQRVASSVKANFRDPIVTELSEAPEFYKAEAYHQNYYDLNSNQGYCKVVIAPKIDKLQSSFSTKLKQ